MEGCCALIDGVMIEVESCAKSTKPLWAISTRAAETVGLSQGSWFHIVSIEDRRSSVCSTAGPPSERTWRVVLFPLWRDAREVGSYLRKVGSSCQERK